ncbi:hypothetical protein [Halobacillus hunanensis]|uniref:hypothetical protein n=1 Tax=Halobacillus hunanensis TaxID=578214 RepID=UPI0009A76978|nr:hypothetical protein [Halobacillus hunanensis]
MNDEKGNGEKLFTGPNTEQERMLDYSNEDYEKFAKSVSEYRKTFKPYLSENFFESFVNLAGPLRFLTMAHPNYELKVDDIKIEEKENYYEFTVKVSYTNSKSNQSKTKKVKGHAQTNEEGKVTSINYINAEEFRTALD